MKRVLGVTFVLSVVLVGTLMAQAGATPAGQAPMTKTTITSPADYSTVMKEVGSTNGMLGKAIQSGAAADAAKASARLETLFTDVHAYWVAKKVEDASTASANAITAAQAVSKAVAANDMTAAAEARTKLGAQCMACHTAHREKTDAGFIMK
jgi:cytochrome c556